MKKLTCGFVLALVIGIFFAVSAVAEFYVIPVNNKCGPCEGTRSAGGRWCDNGDGTVTDMTTCLVWLKYASWGGAKPWRSGETDCSSPDYVCYDDARYRVSILKDNDLIKSTGESVYLDKWTRWQTTGCSPRSRAYRLAHQSSYWPRARPDMDEHRRL